MKKADRFNKACWSGKWKQRSCGRREVFSLLGVCWAPRRTYSWLLDLCGKNGSVQSTNVRDKHRNKECQEIVQYNLWTNEANLKHKNYKPSYFVTGHWHLQRPSQPVQRSQHLRETETRGLHVTWGQVMTSHLPENHWLGWKESCICALRVKVRNPIVEITGIYQSYPPTEVRETDHPPTPPPKAFVTFCLFPNFCYFEIRDWRSRSPESCTSGFLDLKRWASGERRVNTQDSCVISSKHSMLYIRSVLTGTLLVHVRVRFPHPKCLWQQ